jgi:hypothetical protein
MAPVNSGQMQAGRFQKGQSGNARGKPRGARNKTTRLAESLLDGEADGLVRKCIEMALDGDIAAMRLCVERLIPVRRERSLQLKLPPLRHSADAVAAIASITADVAAGSITMGEGAELSRLIGNFTAALETHDLAQRLEALEKESASNERKS